MTKKKTLTKATKRSTEDSVRSTNRRRSTDKQRSAGNLSAILSEWYMANKRDLPWRENRDPYRIWISEVMLQQTTVTAVIPYYHRFLKAFPTVQKLAAASLEEVYELWSGLGYYSRARLLHQASQELAAKGFPKTADELIQIRGLGPYTSRAVASLAFGEAVGVLDGNVVRVLSRLSGTPYEHWKTEGKRKLQEYADQIASTGESNIINQGLMELGATICTPKSAQCFLCPWFDPCEARAAGTVDQLPLKKPRKESQTWVWTPTIFRRGEEVGLIKNTYAPFLKGQWLFPGRAELKTAKPKNFDLRHGITHHDIYVQIARQDEVNPKGFELTEPKDLTWVSIKDLKKWNPSALLGKTLAAHS